MEIIKKDVGNRITTLRKQYNLTMDELAKIAKVGGRSTINGWEKGRSLPPKDSLSLISQYFNVPENFLLYGSLKDYAYNLLTYYSLRFQNNYENLSKDNSYERIARGSNLIDNLHSAICHYNDVRNNKDSHNILNEEQVSKVVNENLDEIGQALKEHEVRYGSDLLILDLSTRIINSNARNFNSLLTMIRKINDNIDDIDYLINTESNNINIDTSKYTLDNFINSSLKYESKDNNFNVTYKDMINMYYESKIAASIYNFRHQISDISEEYSESAYKYKDKLDNKID